MSEPRTKLTVHKIATFHLPIIIYCIVGLGWLIQGVRYIGAETLMPYHMAVIEIPWQHLDPGYQKLFLGLLKGFGVGSFCVGATILLVTLIPFRKGSKWARWALPAIAATYSGALIYVTRFALLPGAIPILVTATLLGLVLIAAAGSYFMRDTD